MVVYPVVSMGLGFSGKGTLIAMIPGLATFV
jgi:hypothetical protein